MALSCTTGGFIRGFFWEGLKFGLGKAVISWCVLDGHCCVLMGSECFLICPGGLWMLADISWWIILGENVPAGGFLFFSLLDSSKHPRYSFVLVSSWHVWTVVQHCLVARIHRR